MNECQAFLIFLSSYCFSPFRLFSSGLFLLDVSPLKGFSSPRLLEWCCRARITMLECKCTDSQAELHAEPKPSSAFTLDHYMLGHCTQIWAVVGLFCKAQNIIAFYNSFSIKSIYLPCQTECFTYPRCIFPLSTGKTACGHLLKRRGTIEMRKQLVTVWCLISVLGAASDLHHFPWHAAWCQCFPGVS